MQPSAPFRRIVLSSLTALFLSVAASPQCLAQSPRRMFFRPVRMQAQSHAPHAAPPHQTQAPHQAPAPQPHSNQPPLGPNQRPLNQKEPHLNQWMDRHSNLTPEQQQKELENLQGFRDLPPQSQQRLRNQLTQLNRMPPEQRRRLLERNEAIEHLNPAQQQQFRNAVGEFNTLPIDRRRLVARAFRDLREMPPQQRETLLNSDRTRAELSDHERATLSGLLAAEPYVPAQPPNEGTNAGK